MNATPNTTAPPSSHDRDLDRRMTVLETRFDIILRTLATKSDLTELRSELRAEMGKFEAKLHRWMIATIITLFVSQAAAVFAVVTILRPT